MLVQLNISRLVISLIVAKVAGALVAVQISTLLDRRATPVHLHLLPLLYQPRTNLQAVPLLLNRRRARLNRKALLVGTWRS